MAWLILVLAGCFECAWAIGLKSSAGLTRLWPSVFTAVTMAASLYLLGLAMRSIPIGTAYAVWTGIGAVGVAVLGMILFQESRSAARLACIGLIVIGAVGLRVFSRPAG